MPKPKNFYHTPSGKKVHVHHDLAKNQGWLKDNGYVQVEPPKAPPAAAPKTASTKANG